MTVDATDSNATVPAPSAARAAGTAHPGALIIALPVGMVLLLALLLASTPERNSEVWRHLATGRALFAGTYHLGTDPFAYTTEGEAWINHAWLYDAVLYGLHRITGPYLVVITALLAIALAELMLRSAGATVHPWTAAFSVALALVALSPQLVLAPAVISYVLLAFTLWWLERRADAPRITTQWPLFLAMLAWANCDEWFVLGPITIGLFALGMLATARPGGWRLLGVGAIALAVGLVNPYHVRVFALPAAVFDASVTLEPARSPLRTLSATSLAAMPIPLAAYLLLIALCVLAWLRSRSWRLSSDRLILAALLALSLYRSAAIPFFAVAAGPFLGRAWSQGIARPLGRRTARAGAAAGVLAFVGLAFLACRGWLQGTHEPRGWFLRTDPSLRQLAEQVAERRHAGQIDDATRICNDSVDVAHYLEWFCPDVKVFIDSRPHVFPPGVVADFHRVRRALGSELTQPSAAASEIRAILAPWQATDLLVGDPVERPLITAMWHLWQAPTDWSLVAIAGRATIFTVSRPTLTPLDPAHAAFRPDQAPAVPRQAPQADLQPPPWWDCFVWSEPAGRLDRDEALVYLAHFEAMQPAFARRNRANWQVKLTAAALANLGPYGGATMAAAAMPIAMLAVTEPGAAPASPAWLALVQRSLAQEGRHADDGPAGSLLLAIRAARRAVDVDPTDALAHLRLGHAYERLHEHTVERAASAEMPLLDELRRVQAIAALTDALRLRPDLMPAHQLLAGLYERSRALDLAWKHLEEQVRLSRAAGPRTGETPTDFKVRIDGLAAREQALGREVRQRLNLATAKSFELKPYAKARLAESYGLPGHALDLLRRASYGQVGIEGVALETHLLLHAGRHREVYQELTRQQKTAFDSFNEHWLRTLAAAACGDYATAQQALAHIEMPLVGLPARPLRDLPPRAALGLVLGQFLLQSASLTPWAPRDDVDAVQRQLTALALAPRQQADFCTIRALLHLETGDIDAAQNDFNRALATWNGDDGSAAIARHYLELMHRR